MNKVAIYTRVSTMHQIDKDSLPLQRKDLINYAEYILNIKNYVVFEDAGYSGKNTDRPAFKDMMSRIKKGEFTHLLVWKIDRISRNLLDFCDMYNELKVNKCTFISRNEQFDTSSAMGEAMLKIILVFAELERKLTGERVKAVMLDRATKGLWNGAPIPLGYKWDKDIKFPVVYDEEAKTVKLIYEQYLKTESSAAVMKILNTQGIKTKKNGHWSSKTISDIIRNPFYKGTYRYNHRETNRGTIKDKKEWIVLEDNHPSIISKELWQRCNEIMDKNALRNNARFRNDVTPHVFSGLLVCGECSNPLYGKLDKVNKYGFKPSLYACKGRYNHLGCSQKTISDKKVGTFIFNFLRSLYKASNKLDITIEEFEKYLINGNLEIIGIENIESVYTSLFKEKVSYAPTFSDEEDTFELDNLNKEKEKYKRALNRLDDLFLFDDVGMSEKDYILKKNNINNKLNEINNKLKKLSNKSSTINNEFIMQVQLFKFADLLKQNTSYDEVLKEVGREILKDFFSCIFERILIKDKRIIEIEFKNKTIYKFIYNIP